MCIRDSLIIAHPDFPWADQEHVIDQTIDRIIAGFTV